MSARDIHRPGQLRSERIKHSGIPTFYAFERTYLAHLRHDSVPSLCWLDSTGSTAQAALFSHTIDRL